jgi:hypothetical protein
MGCIPALGEPEHKQVQIADFNPAFPIEVRINFPTTEFGLFATTDIAAGTPIFWEQTKMRSSAQKWRKFALAKQLIQEGPHKELVHLLMPRVNQPFVFEKSKNKQEQREFQDQLNALEHKHALHYLAKVDVNAFSVDHKIFMFFVAALINHGCQPNVHCYMCPNIILDGQLVAATVVIALTDIKAGEELRWKYANTIDFKCTCPHCNASKSPPDDEVTISKQKQYFPLSIATVKDKEHLLINNQYESFSKPLRLVLKTLEWGTGKTGTTTASPSAAAHSNIMQPGRTSELPCLNSAPGISAN